MSSAGAALCDILVIDTIVFLVRHQDDVGRPMEDILQDHMVVEYAQYLCTQLSANVISAGKRVPAGTDLSVIGEQTACTGLLVWEWSVSGERAGLCGGLLVSLQTATVSVSCRQPRPM